MDYTSDFLFQEILITGICIIMIVREFIHLPLGGSCGRDQNR